MDKLVIKGGKKLSGTVSVCGAKNAVLPLMAATLLTDGTHQFKNVPHLRDVQTMQKLLRTFGLQSQLENNNLTVVTKNFRSNEAPYDLVKTMRASVLVLGPLLARFGRAKVALPGGCAIGARPINLHLQALEQLGAQIEIHEGYVEARCSKLKGNRIFFETVTVTGTENLMMAACLADGKTILKNAAREPEVVDLANYLCQMGANIQGAGTDTITIEGGHPLQPTEHTVIADRIEAATYLMAGAITGGSVTTVGCPAHLLETPLNYLKKCGCQISSVDHTISLTAPEQLLPTDMVTAPFPGFITDLQAQFMALMTLAK
ncbi:MAG: UDP-N-acetylglucosamine 1-carboxyvinyltransferase [Deltaproteobacteria bacterium]|nr:UDP-N-acetylglucosamine 1-carboxyvinyltransferase [Deltaproteobacteria bacterium]